MTPAEFAEFTIINRGEPISLRRRPWLPYIYNLPIIRRPDGTYRRKIQLVFGRQCEKSTTLANMEIALANIIPYLRVLYVTASNTQMREFSDERLRAVIMGSPKLLELSGQVKSKLRSRLTQREVQNVQTKRWLNGSKQTLRSAYRNPSGADRVRGIPADLLNIDEIQDILLDHLPVIEETLFHSELEPGGPISMYSGTPKTFSNPLEDYWSKHSTRNEWAVKCDACTRWNIIEDTHVGLRGLICEKCGRELNPVDGHARWVRTGSAQAEWEGFRVPQPVVVYAWRNKLDHFKLLWKNQLEKKERYSRAKHQNEVMARSFDQGLKPVTLQEVQRCCDPDLDFEDSDDLSPEFLSSIKWGGLDWGGGTTSFTVASCWTYDADWRFRCLWAKKYEGIEADPDWSVDDIIRQFKRLGVRRIGVDWGFGFHTNPKIFKAFGPGRVVMYQHAGRQGPKVNWDPGGLRFITHRTRVLEDCFQLIKKGRKNGGVVFPRWPVFEKYGQDILNVFQEMNERAGELEYKHSEGYPDDFLQSFCYALMVSQLDVQRPDLQSPGAGKT